MNKRMTNSQELDLYSKFVDSFDENGYLVDSNVTIENFITPRPCLHLICNNHNKEYGVWGSFWDQFGGGFSCLDSVMAGPMTSHHDTNYVPTAPELQDFRGFYIYENGKSWEMFPNSNNLNTYTDHSCVQGIDYHKIKAEREKISSEITAFVHPDLPIEVWEISMTNLDSCERNLSWFSQARINIDSYPFYYFVPRVVCEGIYENDAMVFLNHDSNNKNPRNAFFTSYPLFDRYDMSGECFNGMSPRHSLPLAVTNGECTNSLGKQPYAGLLAAAQYKSTLKPGETKKWTCFFGTCPYDTNERNLFIKNAHKILKEGSENILNKTNEIWKNKISTFKIATKDTSLNRYFNIWSNYQARNQSRFCRALDKIGYRDVLQDLLGICSSEPEYVKTILLKTLTYQFDDGIAIRQYEKFKGGGHDMRMYMDSSSWIADLLVTYLKETGDYSILELKVPYLNRDTLQPDESNKGSVLEHALKSVNALFNSTGYHGLCKMGYGDWNDALSGIGGENGVSIWLSCMCVYAAKQLSELCHFINETQSAQKMAEIAKTMTDRINQHAWDGKWYIYAINGDGNPIGSETNIEGKIHLNVNTWAIFTGVAKAAKREEQVWDSLVQLSTEYGHKLITPPYTSKSRSQVGRIADQIPGMFENGSIYTHGEAFFLYALISAGKSDDCYEQLTKNLPSNLNQTISTSPRQQQSNFTVGPDNPDFGKQLFSNFTGSVSWYRKVIEKMLGVYPDYDSLVIKPAVPQHWDSYKISRTVRGKNVEIELQKTDSTPKNILNNEEYTDSVPYKKLSSDKINTIKVFY